MTGTMWHTYFEGLFRGKPVMTEVKLDKYLPTGWSGTADWVIWSDEYQGFILGDLKTIKGEGIKWVEQKGIKEEHQWQVSSYWWGLYHAGFPMVDGYIVYYLPQNQVIDRGGFTDVRPLTLEGKPLPEEVVKPVMEFRWGATKRYLDIVEDTMMDAKVFTPKNHPELFLNSALTPVQERVVKLMKNYKNGNQDVVLVPHWSAAYCPFPNELCNCREQGTTKIGHITTEGEYIARKGFEDEFAVWRSAQLPG